MLAGLKRVLAQRTPELLVIAVAFVLYAPVLFGGSWFLDVFITEVHPHAVAIQRALRAGTLPWWVPELMFGYPLAFNPQVGALYPPNLLLLWALDAETALGLSAALHTALAGLGGVALARHLGLSSRGAAVTGVCLAGSPFLAFYHQALHGLIALAWAPWMLLAGLLLDRAWSWRAFWGLSLSTAMALYAGHVQLVLLAGLATALTARRLRGAVSIAGAGVVGVLLYGPQLLAARVLYAESLRRHLDVDTILASLDVETYGSDDLIEMLLPNALGGPSLHDFWYPEYLGPVLALVVLGALSRGPARRVGLVLSGSGLAALLLVHVPGLNHVLLSIPGLQLFRAPGRFAALVWLGTALLAGLGATTDPLGGAGAPREPLGGGGATTLHRRVVWGLGLVLGVLGAVALLGGLDGLAPRDTNTPIASLTAARRLDALLLVVGALVLLASLRFRSAAALVVIPLVIVAARYVPTTSPRREPPAVRYLRSVPHGRVLGVGAGFEHYLAAVPGGAGWPHGGGQPARAAETLVPDTGLLFGLSGIHAQTSLPIERVVRRLYGQAAGVLDYPPKQEPEWSANALRALGVSHVVAPRHGQLPVRPRPTPAFERDGVVVHSLGPTRGLAEQAGRTLAVERTAVSIAVALPGEAGRVSVQEALFPGWSATVDGVPMEIVLDDGAFMGVDVPLGAKTLVLSFDPLPFRKGLWLLAAGLAALSVSAARLRRRGS